jgi:hypothetical protein
VGFWDVLRGQTRPRPAKLDALFSLPSAAMTLQASMGLQPRGVGSVCFRAAEGQASAVSQQEATDLIDFDGGPAIESHVDEFGYTWLTVRTDPPDTGVLVTDLHAVNSSLEEQGFGPSLLCSVVSFTGQPVDTPGPADDAPTYLVYLYKRGTFYPFCPTSASTRDSLRERQVRDAVGVDLPVEEDTSRWLPLWGIRD